MGIQNLRAVCPTCGTKIHTQKSALGYIALGGRSGPLTRTGSLCPGCHLELSGKVGMDGKAIAADDPRITNKAETLTDNASRILGVLGEEGPQSVETLQARLGLSSWDLAQAQTKLGRGTIRAKGFGPKRMLSLRPGKHEAAA